MQNRSKYLGGNAGSTLKKSMVKTTNTSPEGKLTTQTILIFD